MEQLIAAAEQRRVSHAVHRFEHAGDFSEINME